MITAEENQTEWSAWKPQWTGQKQTPHDLQEAAVLIASSFDLLNHGIGYTPSNWQRLPGSRGAGNIGEAHARLINFYFDWARKCAVQKISHAMVVDVLSFGLSCRTVDRNRRLKNGSTKINLMQGLSLYCELQGWV